MGAGKIDDAPRPFVGRIGHDEAVEPRIDQAHGCFIVSGVQDFIMRRSARGGAATQCSRNDTAAAQVERSVDHRMVEDNGARRLEPPVEHELARDLHAAGKQSRAAGHMNLRRPQAHLIA